MATLARISNISKGFYDKLNQKKPFVLVTLTVKRRVVTELGVSFNDLPYAMKFEDDEETGFKAFDVVEKLEGKEFIMVNLIDQWLIKPKDDFAGRKEATFASFVKEAEEAVEETAE